MGVEGTVRWYGDGFYYVKFKNDLSEQGGRFLTEYVYPKKREQRLEMLVEDLRAALRQVMKDNPELSPEAKTLVEKARWTLTYCRD